jgi:hypothetical protein
MWGEGIATLNTDSLVFYGLNGPIFCIKYCFVSKFKFICRLKVFELESKPSNGGFVLTLKSRRQGVKLLQNPMSRQGVLA